MIRPLFSRRNQNAHCEPRVGGHSMSLPPYDQSVRDFERHYQVVLPDSVGQAAIGFRDGAWFRLNGGAPHPVPIRSAIIICPHAAGSIVQIVCWWMRENTRSPRAL